jgi:hypothetical protein
MLAAGEGVRDAADVSGERDHGGMSPGDVGTVEGLIGNRERTCQEECFGG